MTGLISSIAQATESTSWYGSREPQQVTVSAQGAEVERTERHALGFGERILLAQALGLAKAAVRGDAADVEFWTKALQGDAGEAPLAEEHEATAQALGLLLDVLNAQAADSVVVEITQGVEF